MIFTDFLPRGQSNAIPAEDLCRLMGFRSTRAMRKSIQEARANGELICSTTRGGYFIPESRQEIQEYIDGMTSHAKTVFVSIRSARKALSEVDGQGHITD